MTREEIILRNLSIAEEGIKRIKRRMKHFYNRDYNYTAVLLSEKVLLDLWNLESLVAENESKEDLKKMYGLTR
jgi:hypothetical protein